MKGPSSIIRAANHALMEKGRIDAIWLIAEEWVISDLAERLLLSRKR